jgi:site-specific DNA recombinase
MSSRAVLKAVAKPMRAAVYCRVSTEEQKKNYSLGSQQGGCIRQGKQSGYLVEDADVFSEDFSGFYLYERKVLNRLRDDIRAGKYRAVICHAVDRLSREQAHLYILVEEFTRHGCELIFVTEKIDDSPEGKLMMSVRAFVAEVERQKILERTMRGKRARVESGKVPNFGGNLYGYTKDKERGVRVPDEPEAAIVHRIFSLIGQGNSVHQVLRTLNDEGVSPPGAKRNYKDRRISLWKTNAILRIVRNPAYKGEAVAWTATWEREGAKRYLRERDPSEHIKLPPSACPALVPPELWERVQKVVDGNRRGGGAIHTRNEKKPHLLRGLVSCMECGSPMYPTSSGGKKKRQYVRYYRYRCRTMFLDRSVDTCTGESSNADALESIIWERVVDSLKQPDQIERELTKEAKESDRTRILADLENCERQLDTIERGRQRYIKLLGNVDDVLAQSIEQELLLLGKRKVRVQADIKVLKARLQKHEIRHERLKAIRFFCGRVEDALNSFSFDEKRDLLESVSLQVQAKGAQFKATWQIPAGESPEDGVVVFQTC